MNERIENLMLEATKDMPQGYYVPGQYFQKFAELIVQECAGIYDKIDNGNLHMGTDNYLEALQKHFGDKEK